ncbi:MAG: CHAT domain-containing protein [Cyanobacteria bacterium P01_H01_bin.119]
MTQEFHISITAIGDKKYFIRTEQVEPGVPLAEVQMVWDVDSWIQQARQLMQGPLFGLLQGFDQAEASRSPADAADRDQNLAFSQSPSLQPDASALDASVVTLGQQLYHALFQGLMRDSWIAAQGVAQNRRQLLRLRLGLKAPQLQQLPWEVMNSGDGQTTIATGTNFTFCRYWPSLLNPARAEIKPRSPHPEPIRVLMAIASPQDQVRLALSREVEHLQQELKQPAVSSADEAYPVHLTLLIQPDRAELTRTLEQGRFHVLHYAGHSDLGDAGGDLHLVNRQSGLTERLSGEDLAGLLVNNGIQLAIFNSCRSAYTDEQTDLGSSKRSTSGWPEQNLAQALLNRGIPAVIAMAERIPDGVAIAFSQFFYRNLKTGCAIDLSLNRTRQALVFNLGSDQHYWALPVLYMQPGFDGYLGGAPASDLLHSMVITPPSQAKAGSGAAAGIQPGANRNTNQNSVLAGDSDRLADGRLAETVAEGDNIANSADSGEDALANLWDDEVDLDAIATTFETTEDNDYAEDSAIVGDIMAQLSQPASATDDAQPLPSSEQSPTQAAAVDALDSIDLAEFDTVASAQIETTAIADTFSPLLAGSHGTASARSDSMQPSPNREFVDPGQSVASAKAAAARPRQWTFPWRRFPYSWLWFIVGAIVVVGGAGTFRLINGRLSEAPPAPSPQPRIAIADDLATTGRVALNQQPPDYDLAAASFETLLDDPDNRLREAEQIDQAIVDGQHLNNPRLLYLHGRFQWQQAQLADNPDFNFNDAGRSWQGALEETKLNDETLPNRIEYNTALGFFYYSQGDMDAAQNAWSEAIRLGHQQRKAVGSNPELGFPGEDFINAAYVGAAIAADQNAQTTSGQAQLEWEADARASYCLIMANRETSAQFDNPGDPIDNPGTYWLWTPEIIRDWNTADGRLAGECDYT